MTTAAFVPQITLYRKWLSEQRALDFATYEDLRQWSIRDVDGFWTSIWDYFELQSPTPQVLWPQTQHLSFSRMPTIRLVKIFLGSL